MRAFAVTVLLLPAFLLVRFFPAAHCSVHHYSGEKFFQTADAFLFRGGREGLFTSTPDAVAHWTTVGKGLANGKAYIRFDHLRLHRPLSEAEEAPAVGETGLVEALIFPVEDRGLIGFNSANGIRHFCCSPELVRKTGCNPGHVIYQTRGNNPEWPKVVPISFIGNSTVVESSREVSITRTGMYYLWFVICDKNLAGVSVTGSSVWKNPMGYLPGMMAPYLNFYGVMSLVYLALGLVWLLQYVRHWRDVLHLQHCLTAVIFLSMVEMAAWYHDFVNFNASGSRPIGITVWAVTIGALRKTVSRLLVLVVAMGYGVVRPTLGGLTRKVLSLAGSYLLATECLDVMQHVGAIDDLNSTEKLFLVLPVAVLDAVFILWIFTSLSKTLALLQTKRTTYKLDLYRSFTNALAISVLTSMVWIGYELYTKVTDQFNEKWQFDWVNTAFWHILTFLLLAIICILWAPSQASTRYAYSEDAPDDDDEIMHVLASAAPSTPSERVLTGHAFADELEEGKLE